MNKPFAITLDVGSSLANHTGSWRTERPVYVDRLPPCNHACPAGENIQAWLYHAEAGDYYEAWKSLVENNPLPAIMGRACYHPCESACNRGQLDQAGKYPRRGAFPGRRSHPPWLAIRASANGPESTSWWLGRDRRVFLLRITCRAWATR